MALGQLTQSQSNENHHGTTNDDSQTVAKPLELALDLPRSPGMRVNLHLTLHASAVVLFISTSSADASGGEGSGGAATLGSFVYAMPDRYNPTQPMSTALYSLSSSLDFATRMGKVLARRLARPCYVGGSLDLSGAAAGGTVDEETDAFRLIVRVVLAECERLQH